MSTPHFQFVAAYRKLLQGSNAPAADDGFWNELLGFEVDSTWLKDQLGALTKEQVLGPSKAFLSTLFSICIVSLQSPHESAQRTNALETLIILISVILSNQLDLAGWEVMEVCAGSIDVADRVFTDLVNAIHDILRNEGLPVSFRHRTLQLALVFICGIKQLSPGAYLLRRDFFSPLVDMMTRVETQRFTFEATLMLSLLSNFHKSDAANLNPYLKHVKESVEDVMMRRICWAANFAGVTAVKAYQAVEDDSPPTIVSSLNSFIASMRPDRALSATPIELHKDEYKSLPLEAAVICLPVSEYLHHNQLFRSIFLETLVSPSSDNTTPLPNTLLSLSSYILTHASSTASLRCLAYANLSLNILLVCAEHTDIIRKFTQNENQNIRLCRQRLPLLPLVTSSRPPICALLDCCVLWLQHNIQKKLPVVQYLKCTWILQHAMWFIAQEKIRLEYHWEELWRALISILEFLANKVDVLRHLSRISELPQETLVCLHMALLTGETFLATPQAVHQLVYELVRSSPIFAKQQPLLDSLELPTSGATRGITLSRRARDGLAAISATVAYYETKLSGSQTVKDVMKVISTAVESDGIYISNKAELQVPSKRSFDGSEFIRYACGDILALLV